MRVATSRRPFSRGSAVRSPSCPEPTCVSRLVLLALGALTLAACSRQVAPPVAALVTSAPASSATPRTNSFKFASQTLTVRMKYSPERERTISGIKRISKPGLRVYRGADKLPRVLGGLGVAVLSTSQGLMTDTEARKRKVGGEILCYVW